MTEDPRKQYIEAAKEYAAYYIDELKIDIRRAYMNGCKYAEREAHNRAIDEVYLLVTKIKIDADRFYNKAKDSGSAAESQLCLKVIEELKKLRK